MPGVHGEAAVRPVEGQKAPAVQGVGARIAGCGQKLPAGQGVQNLGDAPPEVEEEPGGQTPSGAERPVAEQKLPAVQGLQADWPARS